MNEQSKPKNKGWYKVEFTSSLCKKERDIKDLTDKFEDFVFFDGRDWETEDYTELGFYISSIIKQE